MKTITHTLFLIIGLGFASMPSAYSQDPSNTQSLVIPAEDVDVTEFKNTFVDYHSYILKDENFRFRKEIKKVKSDEEYLEYASADNQIRISKLDYMRLMRKAVNQSETKQEFLNHINTYFVDKDQRFAEQVDFEAIYDATRATTFYGYFDGLPRINYNY